VLGVVVYKKGILDLKGTLAATYIGLVIVYFAGFDWLILLLVFLFTAYIATRFRYSFKSAIRVSESNSGKRSITHVLANGLVPTAFAVIWYIKDSDLLASTIAASYIAAVATVTGDTLSSEIGVLSKKKPLLITTLEKVPPGTNGGVTILGTFAGILGAFIIGLTAWILKLASFETAILVAVIGGTFGFTVDSVLGAVFERRGLIGNGSVNFLSTLAGSIAGLYVYLLI
jgi:uncharacterized protein (TIGR00297 family)